MARYSRDTLEQVFLDVARGRAQDAPSPLPVPQESVSPEAMS